MLRQAWKKRVLTSTLFLNSCFFCAVRVFTGYDIFHTTKVSWIFVHTFQCAVEHVDVTGVGVADINIVIAEVCTVNIREGVVVCTIFCINVTERL